MTPRTRLLLGVAVSAVLLGLLFVFVDMAEVGRTLRAASPRALAGALILHIVILLLRVHRWIVIAEGGRRVSRARGRLALDSVFFGWFANFALPAKAGDLARPLVYGRGSGRPFAELLAGVAVERVLDLLFLGWAFWLAVMILPTPEGLPAWVRWAATGAGVGAAAVAVGMLALRRFGPAVAPGVRGLRLQVARFGVGLRRVEDPRVLARAAGWTAVVWALEGVAAGFLIAACGAEPSASAALAVVVGITLAVAAPSAPAQVGVSQWVTLLVLAPYGIPADVAVAVSLLDSATVLFWVLPFGLVAAMRQGGVEAIEGAGEPVGGQPRESGESGES